MSVCIYKYLLKQWCICPKGFSSYSLFCLSLTLLPTIEEAQETTELMPAMRHLNKLYQANPKIIPSNMRLISALENYFQSPYQNPLLFIYHFFLWPWSQQWGKYPPQGSNYSSPLSVPAALFCQRKKFTFRASRSLLLTPLDRFCCVKHCLNRLY